jgi:hypothetical protein
MPRYTRNVWTGLSRFANALLGGDPAVTLCARAWGRFLEGRRGSRLTVIVLNRIHMDPQHCLNAWNWHLVRGLVNEPFDEARHPW